MVRWRPRAASRASNSRQNPPSQSMAASLSSRPGDDQEINALTQEIAALSDSMRDDLQAADRGVAAAGALIVAGLGVALLQKATIVLVALPYGLGVVFFYTLQKYAERLSSAGIRSYLEEALRRVSNGRSPVMQQHVADSWHARRSDEKVAYGLYGLVIFASIGVSLYIANRQTALSNAVPLAHWMSAKHHLVTLPPKFSGLAYVDAIALGILIVALCFPYNTMSRAKDIARRVAEAQGSDIL